MGRQDPGRGGQTDIIRVGNSDVDWLMDSWLSVISFKQTSTKEGPPGNQ